MAAESYLTVAEIAERLRVSGQTVRNWIDDGLLPAVRFKRALRIRSEDLERMLAALSTEARPVADAVWDEPTVASAPLVVDPQSPHG